MPPKKRKKLTKREEFLKELTDDEKENLGIFDDEEDEDDYESWRDVI